MKPDSDGIDCEVPSDFYLDISLSLGTRDGELIPVGDIRVPLPAEEITSEKVKERVEEVCKNFKEEIGVERVVLTEKREVYSR